MMAVYSKVPKLKVLQFYEFQLENLAYSQSNDLPGLKLLDIGMKISNTLDTLTPR